MKNGRIYAKNITPAQKAWLQKYLDSTTFEPMFQDELTAGTMTFQEVARENLDWFERWMSDAFHNAEKDLPE